MTDEDIKALGWSIPANLRWLAEQPDRPGYTPCGALTGRLLTDAAAALEAQVARAAAAEEERDRFLGVKGFRPVAWMVKARRRSEDANQARPVCGKVFMTEETAVAAAARLSNRWRLVEPFPVFAMERDVK